MIKSFDNLHDLKVKNWYLINVVKQQFANFIKQIAKKYDFNYVIPDHFDNYIFVSKFSQEMEDSLKKLNTRIFYLRDQKGNPVYLLRKELEKILDVQNLYPVGTEFTIIKKYCRYYGRIISYEPFNIANVELYTYRPVKMKCDISQVSKWIVIGKEEEIKETRPPVTAEPGDGMLRFGKRKRKLNNAD